MFIFYFIYLFIYLFIFYHDTWHCTVIKITYHNEGSKKVESQHVVWASGSIKQILLALRDHFLVIIVNDFLADDLPGSLPIGLMSFKSYLPRKKVYLSFATKQVFSSESWWLLDVGSGVYIIWREGF